jgi:hypothetical protein
MEARDNNKTIEKKIRISLEKRMPSDSGLQSFVIVNEIKEWNIGETAIIICDM